MSLSPELHPRGQPGEIGVVELHPQGATLVVERDPLIEATVVDPEVIEQAESLACEVAQLGVGALRLELDDDDQRQHDLVLVEAVERPWIGQQDRRVQDVALAIPAARVRAGRLGIY